MYEFSRVASYRMHYLQKPPKYLDDKYRRLAEESVTYASLSMEELKAEMLSILGAYRRKYNYLDYYMKIHNSLAALAFVAVPPDSVWEGKMDPWYYIRYYFFVHRNTEQRPPHRPIVARYYSTFLYYYYLQFFKKPHGPIYNLYRQYLEKELQKHQREAQAKKHAFRKVVRTIIGNMYLVATLDEIRSGRLKPSKHIVPKFLVEHPEKTADMINPGHYLEGYNNYTWEALLKYVINEGRHHPTGR